MKKVLKSVLAVAAAASLMAAAVPTFAAEAPTEGGTIIWLSNLQSGAQYDSAVNYMTALCEARGYDFQVVYGDSNNDAAGNLQQVKNAMTSDVKGIIASQDGGLATIMEEYPDVYVVGYNTDMNSVFADGENAACLENDHFLGTIADGYVNGEDAAKTYFNECIEKGYKKVAVVNFPAFAYPNLEVAANAFISMVDEYNATAADEDKIEIVGEITTLMFSPLEDSWFLEDGHSDLDAIIGCCAGIGFIYPTLVTAIANGTCSPATKLVTSGFESDEAITCNIGDSEGKIISAVTISAAENPAYSFVLLDNAITGNQYDDFEVTRVDSFEFIIDSDADIENVLTKSLCGTADVEMAMISVDTVVNELCKANNPDATFAQLQEIFHNADILSTDAIAAK